MNSRLAIAVLVVGALAFACGPRTHSSEPTKAPASMERQEDSPLASSLEVTVQDGVRFAFNVMNATDKRIEVAFPSGQTHEIVVLDARGAEVWRWSEGRMFTQAFRTSVLDAGETMRHEETWRPGGAQGTFTAVATLRSSSHPVEQRVEFSLP